MDRTTAKAAIVELVMAGKVAYTKHADIRSPKRGKFPLTREQNRNCLVAGVITEGPAPDIREADGWKVTVTRMKDGEKHEVSALLIITKRVLVITGYGWEKVSRPRPLRSRLGDETEDS